ncbi:heavy-metal-associated domain-containing protein [Kribbella sp. CA-294648]|uniref:heavy-metal-associated domain-containing protein n=1 Tax=Kribbella sp. CA-294648 TaxID=3239948 RepID=UPI003D8BD35E
MPTDPPPASYDRAAAARILFELAAGEPFRSAAWDEPTPRTIEYREEVLRPARGSHLTAGQLSYVLRYLQPCPTYLVTSAGSRITWRDSDGIVNVGHTGPLGAAVPVVAREATLMLWKLLASNQTLARRSAELRREERAVLAATTTDRVPLDIFRTGIDAAAKALVQHAFLARQTSCTTPAEFARALLDGGIFKTVAGTWYWSLQATTYRRGIIPASLVTYAGQVRYSVDTTINLRALKDAQLEAARELADRARSANVELGTLLDDGHGTTPSSAAQYAHLEPGDRPRCPAQVTHASNGHRSSVLDQVAHAFVETFTHLIEVIEVVPTAAAAKAAVGAVGEVFEVPDMTCDHCTKTITRALGELGVDPPEFDLVTKRVIASFPSADVRERSFEAIRERGYTVVPVT